eukprot:CAMPEP_0197028148 /NCGR_PEP_ID=MMETSP1384-20130603/7905_1 /TAXON_ID=29189 /ORGANISM="Ammonia sp." /LENGTH=292 /DNA_ID=CAMNT_0042457103 /DNA_START=31 /DNA_END=909 /DNA_ORIENTATION=+
MTTTSGDTNTPQNMQDAVVASTDQEHTGDIEMEHNINNSQNEAPTNSDAVKQLQSCPSNAPKEQPSGSEHNGVVQQQHDKENQNTLNACNSEREPQCLRYHGEYNKLLMDSLTRLLDDTFNGWIESYPAWLSLFEQSMKNEPNKILYFYPILLKELKQKIQQHYIDEFEQIASAKHLAALHNREALTLYKDADITPSGAEMNDEEESANVDGKDSNDSSDVLKDKQEEEEVDGEVVRYKPPTVTVRDMELTLINQALLKEINVLDQKIAMAKYKKNELIAKIEQKKQTLFAK